METVLSSDNIAKSPTKSFKISQQLETFRRKLDECIRSANDWSECQSLCDNLAKIFIMTFAQNNLDFAIEEYKKMVTYITKYSWPYLLTIRSPRPSAPLSLFNVELFSRLTDIISQGSALLLSQLVVDERYISPADPTESTCYQLLLDTRFFIRHTLFTQFNQLFKINLLMGYYLLTQSNTEDLFARNKEIIEKFLIKNEGVISALQLLSQNLTRSPTVLYQIKKNRFSALYLKAKLENRQNNRKLEQQYIKEIDSFFANNRLEIQQDHTMSPSFSYDEVIQYLEKLAAQNIKPKKKKSKKKCNTTVSTEVLDILLPDAATATAGDETDRNPNSSSDISEDLTKENHSFIESEKGNVDGFSLTLPIIETDEDTKTHLIQPIQALISKLIFFRGQSGDEIAGTLSQSAATLPQEPYPNIWRQKHENDILDEFITQYEQIKDKINSQLNDETRHPLTLEISSLVIKIGIHVSQMIRDEITQLSKHVKETPILFISLYFQPHIVKDKPNSSFEHFIEANAKLLAHVVEGIEAYANAHFFIIDSIFDEPTTSINPEEIAERINKHIDDAIYFNTIIYPELRLQHSDRKLFYILEKIYYGASYLRARLEKRLNHIEKANQIEEHAQLFVQAYADLIESDKMFSNHHTTSRLPIIPKLKSSMLVIPQDLQLLSKKLQNSQEAFTEFLKEHFNNQSFIDLSKKYLSGIEQSLTDCFQIDNMVFTLKQIESMANYAQTFSFYSLSRLCEPNTRFINENSTSVICGLTEIIIRLTHSFIVNIERYVAGQRHDVRHELLKHNKALFYIHITSVIFASRTYMLLAQAIMDTDTRIDTSKVKKYLKKANVLMDEMSKNFSHIICELKTFNYQCYYLDELNTSIRAKIEEYLGNKNARIALEAETIIKREARKVKFPTEYLSEQFLSSSYGYNELKMFVQWIEHRATQSMMIEENKESAATTKKRGKHKQKSKKANKQMPTTPDEVVLEAEQDISELASTKPSTRDTKDDLIENIDTSVTENPTEIPTQDEVVILNIDATKSSITNLEDIPITPQITSLDAGSPTRASSPAISTEDASKTIINSGLPAPEKDFMPIFCHKNEALNTIFQNIVTIVNQFFNDETVFMYGSALFKENPSDIDLCILNITNSSQMDRVNQLIERFRQFSASVFFNKALNEYGYRDNGRYTIPMIWSKVQIDITISPKEDFFEFSKDLDYTCCAMGYCFKRKIVIQREGLNGPKDITERQLNTIANPIDIFTYDPSRILRGARLVATAGFVFSNHCIQAIQKLIEGRRNIFLSKKYPSHVLTRHLKRLLLRNPDIGNLKNGFYTKDQESAAMYTLWSLGLIPKLIERLINDGDYQKEIYIKILSEYNLFFCGTKKLSEYSPFLSETSTQADQRHQASRQSFFGEGARRHQADPNYHASCPNESIVNKPGSSI